MYIHYSWCLPFFIDPYSAISLLTHGLSSFIVLAKFFFVSSNYVMFQVYFLSLYVTFFFILSAICMEYIFYVYFLKEDFISF